jgi:hypothetical protein
LDDLEPYRKWIYLALVLLAIVCGPAILRTLRAVWRLLFFLITHLILVVVLIAIFACLIRCDSCPDSLLH